MVPGLQPPPPPVVFVMTPHCPLCGRPERPAAVVHGPSGHAHYPGFSCTSPRPLSATCRTELADRSSSDVTGVLAPKMIPVSLTTGERSCFSSAVVPVAPPPHTAAARWFLDRPTPPLVPTILYCNNLGGVETKTEDLENHLLSMDIGYGLYQETWSDHNLRHSIPRRYGYVISRTQGAGTGFLILWAWALIKGPSTPHVAMDCTDWFAVVVETTRYGALLLVSIHLRPHYSFAEKKGVLQAVKQLITLLRPQATIMGGDFNCEAFGDTSPLYYALRSATLFQDFHLAHPPGTFTNWTVVHGVQRCTGIDHILTSPNVPPLHSTLLPSHSTHMGLVTTMDTHDPAAQPFHWKRFKWRLLEPARATQLSGLIDAVWAWVTLYPAPPDHYVCAMWHYASSIVPRPPSAATVMKRLRALTPPLSQTRLQELSRVLRETVAERGRERLAVTLAKVVVTGTTRSALRLPAQPLKPLSRIAPNPRTTLSTPDALKAEIDTQAAMNVQHRHLVLDDHWLHAHTDPQCWEPFFNLVLDLPVRVLLQFLRLGLQPQVPEDRKAYCNRLSSDPVLSDHLMQPSISRPGSWATAVDNIPRRLLQPGGFGLSAGVLASRRQAWLGLPSLSTMPVQYGIYKGKTPNDRKKPPNLMTSYRPVVAESPVTGAEAHAAKSKLDRTLEASALYPPDYFAYRDELRAAELALVSCAACTSSLEVYGSVARCGWDESDAYLRKQRDHVQPLCCRLSPAWNYGEWAAGFYSQLCIRVVSADGLTPGYTPEEGYSQGNPFSANGYQGASVLASSSLPFPKHIRIPPWPSPTALPINRVCYSDDRAFFEPTIARVSIIAGECVRATLHTNGVPNMDNLEFSYHTLDAGLPQPATVEVPRFKTRTLPAPPLIVGIPIFHTLKPADKLSDLLHTFRSVYHSTRDKPMSPLFMVRSFVAFALSRWDFVFSGVLAPPDWHHDLQVYAHKAYRAAFALPPWTGNAFLHLPLHAGGVGCPSLPLRNLSLLAMTYLHASVSRNPLSRASAVYLLDTMAPFSEGMALRTALATLRTRVHTHPFPHLHDMRVHAHVASDHPLLDVLWVVTDGALAGHRVGGGIVFYSPLLGVLRSYSFGVSVVVATSADAEWLAKLVVRSLLRGWDGQASFLADATASMHCGYTKAPPPPLPPSSTTSSDSWSPPRWGPKSFGCERNTTQVTHTRWRCSSGKLTC